MRGARRALLFLMAICASLLVTAQSPVPGTPVKPSVLFITLDTTRYDRLGCYGNKKGLTPSLDEFAKRATVFEHCQSAIPQTMPSHTTMLSGLQPNRHGVRKNMEVFVPKGIPFLPEELSNAGYGTAAFVSAYVLLGRYGMNRGFQVYDDGAMDVEYGTGERAAGKTLEPALKWISSQKSPWFCWVHLFEPHAPYTPPEPFASRFKKDPYDGEVAAMDAELGNFLSLLWRQGILDNSVVVICGDHGESLGEHGELAHGILLYEATTRVPLIVRLPGQQAGRRVSNLVGLVDLAPTLRELCGLSKVNPCDGASFAAALRGGEAPAERRLYIESMEGYYDYGWAPLYAVVEKPWKFILAPRSELYDLPSDPGEKTSLIRTNRDRAKEMKGWLSAELSREVEGPLEKTVLPPNEIAILKSLGYIAGTPGTAGASYKDPKDGIADLPEMDRGASLISKNRYDEAAPIYEKLWAKEPGSARFALALATCYQRSDPPKALSFAKEAIRLRPDFPQAYHRAVTLLINEKKPAEARSLADLALNKIQDTDGALGTLGGWAAFMAGAPEAEVADYLDRSVRSGEEGFMAIKLRAVLAQKREDMPAALSQLRRFVAVAPQEEIAKLKGDPMFQPLRQEPEFWKLLLATPKAR